MESEYFLLDSKDISVENLELKGKYSFQYVENLHIRNSILDTKDAFWHSDHVTVENSLLRGEYLGWFSRNLTLIHCRIIGTQPFCYCENLKLIGCTMEGTDLSFEYSDVHAEVNGSIDSVKNPKSGTISACFVPSRQSGDRFIESVPTFLIYPSYSSLLTSFHNASVTKLIPSSEGLNSWVPWKSSNLKFSGAEE